MIESHRIGFYEAALLTFCEQFARHYQAYNKSPFPNDAPLACLSNEEWSIFTARLPEYLISPFSLSEPVLSPSELSLLLQGVVASRKQQYMLREAFPSVLNAIVVGKEKLTFLMWATLQGETQTALASLANNSTMINAVNANGDTALILAAQRNLLPIIKALVVHSADLDHQNAEGNTALMIATQMGHLEMVHVLCKAGANANLKNKAGNAALMIATQAQNANLVANLIALKPALELDTKNNEGHSPLIWAAAMGFINIVRKLIEAKAPLNSANNQGNTPLILAAQWNHAIVAKILLAAGAKIDIPNQQGSTALLIALIEEHTQVVLPLLAKGASVNTVNEAGDSPSSWLADRYTEDHPIFKLFEKVEKLDACRTLEEAVSTFSTTTFKVYHHAQILAERILTRFREEEAIPLIMQCQDHESLNRLLMQRAHLWMEAKAKGATRDEIHNSRTLIDMVLGRLRILNPFSTKDELLERVQKTFNNLQIPHFHHRSINDTRIGRDSAPHSRSPGDHMSPTPFSTPGTPVYSGKIASQSRAGKAISAFSSLGIRSPHASEIFSSLDTTVVHSAAARRRINTSSTRQKAATPPPVQNSVRVANNTMRTDRSIDSGLSHLMLSSSSGVGVGRPNTNDGVVYPPNNANSPRSPAHYFSVRFFAPPSPLSTQIEQDNAFNSPIASPC